MQRIPRFLAWLILAICLIIGLFFWATGNKTTSTKPQPELPPHVVSTPEMSSENRTTLTDARIYCDEKLIGSGTVVTVPGGRLIITVRHLFDKTGVYSATTATNQKLWIGALKGDENAEIIVGIFNEKPTKLGPLEDTFGKKLKSMVGNFNMPMIMKERLIVGTNENVLALVAWKDLGDLNVECLDCWLGPGSSGRGIVDPSSLDRPDSIFWVVDGEWLPLMKEQLRLLSRRKDIQGGFTRVTGTTWTKIQSYYRELRSGK